MRRLWLVSSKEPNHEEVFLERYDRLLRQALHITNQRPSAAEDLVHDAFIQFTLSKPELAAINDLDSYLFIVLRNLHLSQVRRASHQNFAPISIADYDSAAIGLRASDIQNHLQIADDLLRICDYVCLRKETSKAASVLILRFFHGYFTSEIAQVIQSPRRTVHEWLRLARNEVKLHLENPHSLTPFGPATENNRPRSENDLLGTLRERIFASRQGACSRELVQLYSRDIPIECKLLAHIVSCPNCLDEVNKINKLPPFSDRYPTDTLGTETRSNSGGHEMNRVTRAEVTNNYLKLCRRRLGEILDHQPQALSFSANGFIVGSQRVNPETTEQILSINIDEELSFVEVFSEQGIRLMFMGVTPSAIGGVEQKSQMKLDDERELECAVSFKNPWPTLHVTYRNLATPTAELVEISETTPAEIRTTIDKPKDSFWSKIFSSTFWLRPEMISAVVVLCALIAFAAWYTTRRPTITNPTSAATILQNAASLEETLAAEKGTVIHHTIKLEEATPTGTVLTTSRIEVWQSADRGVLVRRLYNERGELLAGDWRRADGVQTLYQHGVDPRIQLVPEKRDSLPLNFDQIWQLSLSAKEFKQIANTQNLRVEETPQTVKLVYDNGPGKQLVKASLTLDRAKLNVIGQTLLVQQGNELREFRFLETKTEKHAGDKVPANIFEPDTSLLPEKKKETVEQNEKTEAVTPNAGPTTVIATAELEIDVLKLLNQVDADAGEQIFVRRTPSGVLQVDGVVETSQRKQEILNALSSVGGNPALKLNIETVEERVARENNVRSEGSSISLERIEPTSNSIPLEPELRAYFTAHGVQPAQLDNEVQKFSRSALGHSGSLLQHAGALMNLTGRFSLDELRALDPSARAKWLDLVHHHAQGLRQNAVALQRELGDALGQPRADVIAEPSIESDAMLVQTVNRLFTTASAVDQNVRATLSLSNSPGSAAKIKAIQFWRSLATLEDLSTKLATTK